MKILLNILFFSVSLSFIAQQDSLLIEREQQLKVYLNDLRASKSNEDKNKSNEIFKNYLSETLLMRGVLDYPFSSLKTLGTIKSPDNAFRLFNWNVEQEDRSNKYYCYILRFEEKKKEWITIELIDNSSNLSKKPDDFLDEKNWYGALYYKIIPVEKSNKTVYTILGWDGNNPMSNIKLIDVLSFNGNNAKLGSSIFKMADKTHKRLFFEHSNKAFMSLNYDAAHQRIIYDHLSPETPSMEGFYEYYVPDLSYDELKFVNNKWVIQENVVSVNNKTSNSYTLQYINKNTNELEKANVKNKWVDPSDPLSPNGGNVHVAQLPGEDIEKNKLAKENFIEPKIAKGKKRRSEFSMNPFMKTRKKRN